MVLIILVVLNALKIAKQQVKTHVHLRGKMGEKMCGKFPKMTIKLSKLGLKVAQIITNKVFIAKTMLKHASHNYEKTF